MAGLSGLFRKFTNVFVGPARARPALVAQIFNLLYRRFVIGRAPSIGWRVGPACAQQNAILRYSRLKIGALSESGVCPHPSPTALQNAGAQVETGAGSGAQSASKCRGILSSSGGGSQPARFRRSSDACGAVGHHALPKTGLSHTPVRRQPGRLPEQVRQERGTRCCLSEQNPLDEAGRGGL
jgi:hypothetical protein